MKKRILTGIVGAGIAVAWLLTMYTPAFAIVMAVVACIGVFEMLKVFEVKNKIFFAICELTGFLTALYADYKDKINLPFYAVITGIVLLSLIIMVSDFKKLRFEQVVCSLFSAFLIPAALSTVVLLRDSYITFPNVFKNASDGVFLVLFAFFCSWLTDIFALFTGKAFGKHKLSPNISPKKTVEGAIGGILGNIILCVLMWLVFKIKFNLSSYISVVWVIVSALALSVISIFGDLAASTIKRHHGIKDFGNILPGHGGVMDRFDSSVFVFAALYSEIIVMGYIIGG
ncbi:MAG: phosphatidate cytidylyltransferase [Oscillospiraceae bacterium]|nr:phosphatidate cytidylyltransferase [Oscillospiraceae bacterium]